MVNSILAHGGGIRVALVGLPELWHDIIAGLVRVERNMELVDEKLSTDASISGWKTGASVVIIGLAHKWTSAEAMESMSHIAVVGVMKRGNPAMVYRLPPEPVDVSEVSAAKLLAAVRSAGGWIPEGGQDDVR